MAGRRRVLISLDLLSAMLRAPTGHHTNAPADMTVVEMERASRGQAVLICESATWDTVGDVEMFEPLYERCDGRL
jgi:hypothetical protein